MILSILTFLPGRSERRNDSGAESLFKHQIQGWQTFKKIGKSARQSDLDGTSCFQSWSLDLVGSIQAIEINWKKFLRFVRCWAEQKKKDRRRRFPRLSNSWRIENVGIKWKENSQNASLFQLFPKIFQRLKFHTKSSALSKLVWELNFRKLQPLKFLFSRQKTYWSFIFSNENIGKANWETGSSASSRIGKQNPDINWKDIPLNPLFQPPTQGWQRNYDQTLAGL